MTIPEQAVATVRQQCPHDGSWNYAAGWHAACDALTAALPLVGVQRPEREDIARAICNSQKGRDYDALAEFAKDWWRTGADAVLALPHTGQPGLNDLNFMKAFWRAQPSCLHLACDADCNPMTTHCSRAADVAAERTLSP